MKRLSVYTLLLALLLNLVLPMNTQAFSDISNYPFKEAVEYLKNAGIVEGYAGNVYRPDNPVTRAEMMKIILKGKFDESDPDYKNCFPDVQEQWFAPFICYGKSNGIVNGYDDGTFKPANKINFAEALKISFLGSDLDSQIDKNTSGKWYEPYENFAEDKLIFPKYLYSPNDEVTRGQMAEIIFQTGQYKSNKFTQNIQDRKSKGCGQNPPQYPPSSLIVNEDERDFITVLPKNYDKNKKYPIVFAFHGRTNSNSYLRTYLGVEEASNGEAFFVYPNANLNGTGYRSKNDPNDNIRDFEFFDRMMTSFSQNYCIDLERVYTVGYSLGAWFANSLSCVRGDIIKASVTLGGTTTQSECVGQVNSMILHNPKDRLSPFSSGEISRDQRLSQNNCSTTSNPTEPSKFNCQEYSCSGAKTLFCPHEIDNAWWDGSYYPHVWPKDLGQAAWDFLEKFR